MPKSVPTREVLPNPQPKVETSVYSDQEVAVFIHWPDGGLSACYILPGAVRDKYFPGGNKTVILRTDMQH